MDVAIAIHRPQRGHAPRLLAPDPIVHHADSDGKMNCRFSPRHAALQNRHVGDFEFHLSAAHERAKHRRFVFARVCQHG